MPFFPKDKQSLGIIWHCPQCQKLASGEVGVVNIALPGGLVTFHAVAAMDGQQMGKAGAAAVPPLPKAVHSLAAGLACGAALHTFLLWGMGRWLTWTIKRTAKSVPNILTDYCRQCYKIQKMALVIYREMYVALLKMCAF